MIIDVVCMLGLTFFSVKLVENGALCKSTLFGINLFEVEDE